MPKWTFDLETEELVEIDTRPIFIGDFTTKKPKESKWKKMKKFLSRFFCEHEYVCYDITKEFVCGHSAAVDYYNFICKKCEKTIAISRYEIEDKKDKLNKLYRKNIILKKSEPIEPYCLQLPTIFNTYQYESPGARMVVTYYKTKGIDLTRLQPWKR